MMTPHGLAPVSQPRRGRSKARERILEAAYQLFARQFGTNNLPDCSNMCHESSGTAMVQSIGVGKSTVVFEDFDVTDTIFIIGQNRPFCTGTTPTPFSRSSLL